MKRLLSILSVMGIVCFTSCEDYPETLEDTVWESIYEEDEGYMAEELSFTSGQVTYVITGMYKDGDEEIVIDKNYTGTYTYDPPEVQIEFVSGLDRIDMPEKAEGELHGNTMELEIWETLDMVRGTTLTMR